MDVCSSISHTMCDSERCYSRQLETFNLGGDRRASLYFLMWDNITAIKKLVTLHSPLPFSSRPDAECLPGRTEMSAKKKDFFFLQLLKIKCVHAEADSSN